MLGELPRSMFPSTSSSHDVRTILSLVKQLSSLASPGCKLIDGSVGLGIKVLQWGPGQPQWLRVTVGAKPHKLNSIIIFMLLTIYPTTCIILLERLKFPQQITENDIHCLRPVSSLPLNDLPNCIQNSADLCKSGEYSDQAMGGLHLPILLGNRGTQSTLLTGKRKQDAS